jgi:hydroxymethylpyrimidine pyrophosphatase-like HAD family hydrolase
MKNLLIPLAGKSSRFPNSRPKWMLTHPNGRMMVTEAISGLPLEQFDKIYFGVLKEHLNEFQFASGLHEDLCTIGISDKYILVILDEPTKSQSETVYRMVKDNNIEGYILIKDCDNFFSLDNIDFEHNQVCYSRLDDHESINAKNKSYVQLDDKNYVCNIVEKKIISNTFSVGGYGFTDAKEFIDNYEKLNSLKLSGECYISNIIFEMLLQESTFKGSLVKNYLDWGTIEAWSEFKNEYRTIFCDLDGTLVTNTSWHFPPFVGDGQPIQKNIDELKRVYKKGQTVVIITTSRPIQYMDITKDELEKYGIPYDTLIMGLPHGKRTLVNDYAPSNPYPSCDSINIPRNSDTLSLG